MASEQSLGYYAFLGGVVIAILAGVIAGAGQVGLLQGAEKWVPLALVVLGLVVGFLNIKDKDIHEFLVASIVFLLLSGTAAGLNQIPVLGVYLASIAQSVAVFVAPAALIVAAKDVWQLAQGT